MSFLWSLLNTEVKPEGAWWGGGSYLVKSKAQGLENTALCTNSGDTRYSGRNKCEVTLERYA